MEIDFKKIASEMLEAMGHVVGDNMNEIKDLADDELEDFAKRTATLAEKVASGKITTAQARAILKIRKVAVETVILSVAGISLLAAEEAINAAISVLKKSLNAVLPIGEIL